MTEWLSYTLSDFLPFSERVYVRQLELTNEAVWPAHLLAIAAALALALFMHAPTPSRSRFSALLLGLAWFSTGWIFAWERYAEINWAGGYVAALFFLQGAGLSVLALSNKGLDIDQRKTWARSGLALLVLLLAAVYPALGILAGRSIQSAEVFAISPDPTALITICILAATTAPGRIALTVVPILWCLVSILTHTAMGLLQGWFILLLLVLIATLAMHRNSRTS